jgi:hypothetical protein
MAKVEKIRAMKVAKKVAGINLLKTFQKNRKRKYPNTPSMERVRVLSPMTVIPPCPKRARMTFTTKVARKMREGPSKIPEITVRLTW